jgi:hypothetical protein
MKHSEIKSGKEIIYKIYLDFSLDSEIEIHQVLLAQFFRDNFIPKTLLSLNSKSLTNLAELFKVRRVS